MIDGRTRLCGLIGNPVEHSLSPVMFNAAFDTLGLSLIYVAFQIEGAKFDQAVAGMRALNVRGFNVTMPYKTEIVAHLDALDSGARRIGAVNTVVNDEGHFTGCNTDYSGFLQTLRRNDINLENRRSVLLGAGGAARAVAFALAEKCSEVVILNRPGGLERAHKLAGDVGGNTNTQTTVMELNAGNLRKALENAALLVNATSAGMNPGAGFTPVPGELLTPGLTVIDMVYDPNPTRLLEEAQIAGCRTVDGISLLAAQAEASFELWTGMPAPVGLLIATARKTLERSDQKRGTRGGIALIGFMGSGKSRTGKILARKLGLPLRDTDKIIEANAGKTIEQLFREDGEETFRKLEKEAVREVCDQGTNIIACGGGVILSADNMLALRDQSLIVYLKSSPVSILKRVRANRTHRPLLAGKNKPEAIERLLEYRLPLYAKWADITIDTSDKDAESVAREIITRVREHEGYAI